MKKSRIYGLILCMMLLLSACQSETDPEENLTKDVSGQENIQDSETIEKVVQETENVQEEVDTAETKAVDETQVVEEQEKSALTMEQIELLSQKPILTTQDLLVYKDLQQTSLTAADYKQYYYDFAHEDKPYRLEFRCGLQDELQFVRLVDMETMLNIDIRTGNVEHLLNNTVTMADYLTYDLPVGVEASGYDLYQLDFGGEIFLKNSEPCGGIYILDGSRVKPGFAGNALQNVANYDNNIYHEEMEEIADFAVPALLTLMTVEEEDGTAVQYYSIYFAKESGFYCYNIRLRADMFLKVEVEDLINSVVFEGRAFAVNDFSFADVSNLEFLFSSGVGGWWTELYIHEDGTFEGHYEDSNWGITEPEYPNGQVSYSDFYGSFTEPVKVDDFTYVVQIDSIEYPTGMDSEIIDGVLYDYWTAYGIEGGENFYIYLPGKAYQELPEEFRSWVNDYYRWAWNGNPEAEDATLPFYGFFNAEQGCGFYSYEKEVPEELKLMEVEQEVWGPVSQLQIMVRSRDMWLPNKNYVTDKESCAIADINNNGRLELIVSNHGGTGHYTYNHIYEINETYDGLEKCTLNFMEGDSQPDLLLEDEFVIYRDADRNFHYIVYDFMRDVSEYYYTCHEMTLQEGVVTFTPLATMHESYTNQKQVAEYFITNAQGEEITEEEYNSIGETVFADSIEKFYDVWFWKDKKYWDDLGDEELCAELLESYELHSIRTKSSEETETINEGVFSQMHEIELDENVLDSNWIFVDNPSWIESYMKEGLTSDTKPYELKKIEEKQNEIVDTDEWFERNDLSLESQAMDPKYSYTIGGNGSVLYLYKDGKELANLDFLDYQYARELARGEKAFLTEAIQWVIIEEHVLYLCTAHDSYAADEPLNAYITAIDLNDYSVLWKSPPLISNAKNFEIVGDVIFCGYGFTAEDDYLYQLDKKTGKVLAQEKLKSRAEYIIYQDGSLYVRTYNTDYVFELCE